MLNTSIVTLPNKRQYRLTETKKPYVGGEYPEGGIVISTWQDTKWGGNWFYVDNAPNEECVKNFLHTAERLPPVQPLKKLI